MHIAKPKFIEFEMAVATVMVMFLGHSTGQALAKNPVIKDIATMPQQAECIMRQLSYLPRDISHDEFHQEMKAITQGCKPALAP